MKPTEILSQEHRLIEVVLDCLEKMTDEAMTSQRIDEREARAAIDFFRHFADGCHHAKEENQLFPAMESKGFSRETGPLSVMLYEHTVGRDAVRGMEQAVDQWAGGQSLGVERFLGHARRYLNLLRQHIEKEDHCLFAMAEQAFSHQEQAQLLEHFAQAERPVSGAVTKETCLQIASSLAERFGIDSAAIVATQSFRSA